MPMGTAILGSGTGVQPSSLARVSFSLLNLLPLLSTRVLPPAAGVYVGEGLPPVLPKLAAKILWWEFVDMAEMLPEYWSGAKSKEEYPKQHHPGDHIRSRIFLCGFNVMHHM